MQISQSSEIKGQHRLTKCSYIMDNNIMDNNITRNIKINSKEIKFEDLQNNTKFDPFILIILL